MTDHKAKLSEIRQRHEEDAATYVDHGLDSKQGADAHRDRATLLEIVAGLEAKLQRIVDPPIKRLHVEGGELSMSLDAPEMARIMANAFHDSLTENKADNYVEFTFAKPETPLKKVVVTVRRLTGRTPHELRQQAEQERDTERARAEAAESDAKHVRAINATLLESMAAETKRADAAERALAEAREKVKALPRYNVFVGALKSSARFEPCIDGQVLDRSAVLAALGVES